MMAKVLNFIAETIDIDESLLADYKAVYGVDKPSLVQEKITFDLSGCSIAVANAICRVITDEMTGHCLHMNVRGLNTDETNKFSFDVTRTTEKFMNDHFIYRRLRLIPLVPHIPDELIKKIQFSVHFANTSHSPKILYAGDMSVEGVTKDELKHPLFDPAFELALIQPRKEIHIEGIRIVKGIGKDDIAFGIGRRSSCVPIDLEEYPEILAKYGVIVGGDRDNAKRWENVLLSGIEKKLKDWPDFRKEMDELEKAKSSLVGEKAGEKAGEKETATGLPGEIMLGDWSGYKKSTMLTDARAHRLSTIIPAVPRDAKPGVTGKIICVDACRNIKSRIQYVISLLETEGKYSITKTETGSILRLDIPDETHTIGNLLRKAIFDNFEEVMFVGYQCVGKKVELTVRAGTPAEELRKVITGIVHKCFELYTSLEKQFNEKVPNE